MDKNEIVRKFNSKKFGEWIMRQKIKGQSSMIIRFLQRTMVNNQEQKKKDEEP